MTSGGPFPAATWRRNRRRIFLPAGFLAAIAGRLLSVAGQSLSPPAAENGSGDGSGDILADLTPMMMTMTDQMTMTTSSMAMLTDPMTTTALGMSASPVGLMMDSSTLATDPNATYSLRNTTTSLAMELYLDYAEVNYTLLLPILPNATQVHLGIVLDERYVQRI
jgi:hypothetical protein